MSAFQAFKLQIAFLLIAFSYVDCILPIAYCPLPIACSHFQLPYFFECDKIGQILIRDAVSSLHNNGYMYPAMEDVSTGHARFVIITCSL